MADALGSFIHCGLALNRITIGNTNFTLDQATDQFEIIFQAEEAATITQLGYRYGARTGTPPTYKISLQGVDGNGNPDNTIKNTGASSKTFTPPADASIDGTTVYQTLTTPYTCTRGEKLAMVIAYDSGTVSAAACSSFTAVNVGGSISASSDGYPYFIQNDAGVRTRPQVITPCYSYKSASKTYGTPLQTMTTYTLTQASTPDEVALAFQLPTGWTGSYQVKGVGVTCNVTAAKTINVNLYSGTTVIQGPLAIDTDHIQAAGAQKFCWFCFQDTTLATLSPGVTYRIGFQPQDAAGNEVFYAYTQGSASDWQAYPLSTNQWVSTRTDAGAWTDDLTSRLEGAIFLKDITAPSPGIIVAT